MIDKIINEDCEVSTAAVQEKKKWIKPECKVLENYLIESGNGVYEADSGGGLLS